ncbi:MAG: class I SAM-dependent methyltransferase [Alphaproteobacteria bacterium]|nr:class I SAM-dependent methyltransferase [Alphaproteobacteria bacterium]
MSAPDDYLDRNRAAWSEVADVHARHRLATLKAGFAAPGFSTFGDPDHVDMARRLRQVGFAGKRVAQIGCNNGRETLSAVNEGAASAVGFDFTPKFLGQARELTAAAGLDDRVDWVEANAMDLPVRYDGQFDLVFTTIGVLGWMRELEHLFDGIARYVKPGGHYVLEEMHPVSLMWDVRQSGGFEPQFSYFTEEVYVEEGGLDYYEDSDYGSREKSYSFTHTLSKIVNLLCERGFVITALDESPHDIGSYFPGLQDQPANPPMGLVIVAEKRS